MIYLGSDFSKMSRPFHNTEINYVAVLGKLVKLNYSIAFYKVLNSNKTDCVLIRRIRKGKLGCWQVSTSLNFSPLEDQYLKIEAV